MHAISRLSRKQLLLIAVPYEAVWLVCVAAWLWMPARPAWTEWVFRIWFFLSLPLSIVPVLWAVWPVRRDSLTVSVTLSAVYPFVWQSSVFITDALAWDTVRSYMARGGTAGLFFIGLAWLVWGTERASQYYRSMRLERRLQAEQETTAASALRPTSVDSSRPDKRVWNPLDQEAWYYGKSRKLNQSLTGLIGYCFTFMLALLLFAQLRGCQEVFELPAGGGEQTQIAQVVKVQKIIKKRYVVNPFSAILFQVPPIDEVKLQLTELTKHAYTVGYGKGTGAGFAGGTKAGKVHFIRIEYTGGDWDQDFGIGADLNMLIEYGIRTKHKVEKKTESRTITQLKNTPKGKSPPLVYLTGQKNISLSKNEVKILREYLLEKHGMIFGDNGGSRHFHNQFVSMMGRVLPNVRPVPVALDDVIHRVPYQIPFLPYVAPHGGNQALGWKVDGRWVCYYHPGDIGDAWTDDHSGVRPEVWEYCYQLGTNVIFYANTEYSKWLTALEKNK